MSNPSPHRVGLGVIGLGGFARFSLQHFVQAPGVELVAAGGVTSDEARHAAARYGIPVLESNDELCAHPGIDWVYINTPPFLHFEHAMLALRAGKHVLIEKPLATEIGHAEALMVEADERGLRLVTNLMQRYNPLLETLGTVLREGLLGAPLFFNLTNHAVDQGLPSGHWFWDRDKSGGIFVEHGVHFFDMATMLLGPGRIDSAGSARRASDGAEDQVWCDGRFGSAIARFYHGFNQTAATEAQRFEIVCERGQITMEGWIPLAATITATVDLAATRRLTELAPAARLRVLEQFPPDRQEVRGHGRMHRVDQSIRLDVPPASPKSELYGELLQRLFTEQTAPDAASNSNSLRLQPDDGLESLRLAIAARDLADAADAADPPED
ncbi:Gfo/Idh/MocA family protein [Phycisphaera mikurensis]|uniref:Putative oxidoreductase n=1 Tax=Phycisphaera mikurensis (strain NBRC 102666 / KCTC 22515 / FYK2301M01) TaxID=1142394 RepID=I0IJ46_PHYMF|nr:Gfo/Idh/MocA family oxidoreductase [Phycisphaera mikurensis]MBB6443131.1 putative dehydrogenase [Phycisphaera mikurensis]BAM05284.1 putative oxidoreductase [Phycisphaera mikurensis NBRC 102666]